MSGPYASYAGVAECTLAEFVAEGFSDPVPGVVYHNGQLGRGIPLGGLGTCYIELTGAGYLGDTTIFNHFPAAYTWAEQFRLGQPFLAVAADGQVRVLALAQGAPDQGNRLGTARFADNVAYWGHYPFAELAYTTDLPFEFQLRAWSPFVPGDADASNTPAAVFELSVVNLSSADADVRVGFSFPAFPLADGAAYQRTAIAGSWAGVQTTTNRYGRAAGYAVCVRDAESVEWGAQLGVPARPWSDMGAGTVKPSDDDPGGSVTGRIHLVAGERKVVTFTLAWFYPSFQVGYAFPYEHMYGRRFASALDVCSYVNASINDLRERSLAWQRAVYRQELPAFLRDGLINSLYCLAKNSWWTCASGADDAWGAAGLFTMNETFRDCPVTETVPCRFFGHFPMLLLFPELEKTTLRGLASYQLATGEIPFALAYGSGLYDPRYHCVHPLNSSMFVQMVLRYYLCTRETDFLQQMLPAVKAAIKFLFSLDSDGDGLVNEHPHALPGTSWPANNYHDAFPWYGTSIYTGGTWLASLLAAEALASLAGDSDYAAQCGAWFAKGAAELDSKLWDGDGYLVYNDPLQDRRLDASLLNQLMGEWCTRQLGLARVIPRDRSEKTIATILLRNVAGGVVVPVDTVDRDGRMVILPEMGDDPAARQSAACMVSEAVCFAMTLLWEGRRTEGLQILESIWRAHAITHRTPFDQYYLLDPSDGSPIWGNDYYSNLVVWAVPMALADQDLAQYASSPLIAACLAGLGRSTASV